MDEAAQCGMMGGCRELVKADHDSLTALRGYFGNFNARMDELQTFAGASGKAYLNANDENRLAFDGLLANPPRRIAPTFLPGLELPEGD
ncbi:hypothetical protein [Plantactinospora sp. CA-290183]|uniref:hypothetical protein n=1 Tax=Plantactinospora sp. CA-290183 TaxID=3240006 RepID=UPI003D94716D